MQSSEPLLAKAKSIFEQKDLRVQLSQFQCLGKQITHFLYEEIPTTMLPAEKWDRQSIRQSDIYVFQAQSQSSGRGQKSNLWISPPGNLYITALCKIPRQLVSKLPMLVCSAMAVTCQRQISESQKVSIKWINDVYINDKKIGGTLIKTEYFQKSFISQIGIGINLNVSPNQLSGSLKQFKQHDINIAGFTKSLIQNLVNSISNPQTYIKHYQKNLLFLGDYVKIYDSQLKKILNAGKFKGINDNGHAILQIEGKEIAFFEGRMRL